MDNSSFKNIIFNEDCIAGMKKLPDNSIDCCITSPPYFGLRDYGHDGQIGLEDTPELFVQKMVEVFNEVKRVLKPTGTLWLNLGDSYASSGKNRTEGQATAKTTLGGGVTTQLQVLKQKSKIVGDLKQKDLIGIPWMVAFALRSSGWYLRQDIIWHKPNPMPESVTDRCTKSHEYIFLLSKSPKYYFDAESIKTEALNPEDDIRRANGQHDGNKYMPTKMNNGIRPRKSGNLERKPGSARGCPEGTGSNVNGSVPWEGAKANKRSVWSVGTKPFAEAHFATFPQELIIDMVKAGTSEFGCCPQCRAPYARNVENEYKVHENWYGDKTKESKNDRGAAGSSYKEKIGSKTTGWVPTCNHAATTPQPCIILDPFMGAGTTAVVANKLHREFVGFELNEEYCKIANQRIHKEIGLFK